MNIHTQINPIELHATIKLGLDDQMVIAGVSFFIPSSPNPPKARDRGGSTPFSSLRTGDPFLRFSRAGLDRVLPAQGWGDAFRDLESNVLC